MGGPLPHPHILFLQLTNIARDALGIAAAAAVVKAIRTNPTILFFSSSHTTAYSLPHLSRATGPHTHGRCYADDSCIWLTLRTSRVYVSPSRP